ncbi:protein phosphatase [Ureaplasma diversum]|uniref:Protein phosphatase n=1 Tax=Ureaplasma diversum TaxID=42094 RepID=A0A0C5RC20_9BACT|nr:PP2C family serine/threonine-protein phosphatase [Ureaplasma diversum]AJQ45416.1 protein phosphatase [Ureaplasma diversum]
MQLGFITDIGNTRKHNDDCSNAIINEYSQHLLIVCDGLGGYQGGAAASHIVMNCITNAFLTTDFSEFDLNQIRKWFILNIRNAQKQIDNVVLIQKDSYNMGTTIVASIIVNNHAFILNIGDSRAYLLDHSNVKQLTVDNNLLETLRARKASAEVYDKYQKHLYSLTQFVGRTSNISLSYDLYELELLPNQILFLSSDGFHFHYNLELLYDQLIKANASVDQNTFLNTIIKEAINNGSNDNLSFAFLINN